jgi:DNA polymerase-3 subunit beta
MMTGELFEVVDSELKIVALDGHRIAIRKLALEGRADDVKVVVPGKTLNEISKILSSNAEDMMNVYFTNNHILFEFDDTTVVSRLIEGEYFRINQMISSDYETKVIVNKKEMLSSIDRATLLIRENDKKPIIFKIGNGNMEVQVASSIGSLKENISISKEGNDIMIGFNPKFMMDALGRIDDENISIYLLNPKAPCFIRDEAESYVYVILPVNFVA